MQDEKIVEMYWQREETKRVYLDRPFVYMLVDRENNRPFFIGTLMEVE